MPIYHPSEPPGGEAALRAGLTRLFAESPTHAPTYQLFGRPAQLAHGPPHKVYTVDLRDLAERKLLDAAMDVSWNYPVFADSEPVGELELGLPSTHEEELPFRAFHQTPFTAATVQALNRAEQSPFTAGMNYEVRFLKIPPVYFAALWLHAPKDDILVPLREPPGRLESNREYKEPEVIAALQPSVEQALRFERAMRERDRR
jgi:hypothetical protein